MKAVVVERPNEVRYREVEAPAVGPDDVLVASREAGLCRTDIEMMTGVFTDPRWVRFPVIPGHEWAGTVLEVGANVQSVHVGDRVVCEGFIVCHRCRRCRSGETQWCERIEALGFTRPGGYAELVAVPEQVVHRLPEHVSFDAGVLVEPASVVLRGLEKAGPKPGEAVGVIGVGTLGALAIALLALQSPSRIVAYGVREEELELARRLGATEVVLAEEGAPAEAELDLVVETAGVPAAVTRATQLCRPGGRAVLLGIAGEGRTLTLPSDLFVSKDMTLIGSIAYPASTWSRVVGLVADRVLDLDPIVTHRFPMRDFEEAVQLMDDRHGIVAKIVLEH
ncbi:MAG TPA: alcohol dehydrogenase catalytic domain-containing protein [Solirubrobacteraceae bacterium]|nr:alcohol dehydrogenase catalytic domain-containing protein [Solirubrobacteraceae bacterium]